MFLLNDNEVLVVSCKNYDRETVAKAYKKIIKQIDDKVIKDKSVYIKPNILKGDVPDKVATTHPEIIYPIAKYLKELNCDVLCGDSPNFITIKRMINNIYSITGIAKVINEANCKMDNSSSSTVVTGGKYLSKFRMLTNIHKSNFVINIAKAKTHSFTGYTGAVKNLFGVIPGPVKGEMHLSNPSARAFSNCMIDICERVNANLHIVDAVIGMEGPGPSSGTPKHLGYIVAGKNPYAVDEVVVELMGLNKNNIPQIELAREKKLTLPIDKIKIIGENLDKIKESSVPFTNAVQNVGAFIRVLKFILPAKLILKIKKKPIINNNCIACGICEEACPPNAITTKDFAIIDYQNCIKCYCCQELCPENAITIGKKRK